MFCAYALVAPVAAWLGGTAGLVTAAVAAGLCLLGTEVALLVALPFRRRDNLWQGVMLGMLPRMGIPFCLGLILQILGGTLAESGLLVYLIVFYQVALAAEVAVCLPSAGRPGGDGQAPRNAAL